MPDTGYYFYFIGKTEQPVSQPARSTLTEVADPFSRQQKLARPALTKTPVVVRQQARVGGLDQRFGIQTMNNIGPLSFWAGTEQGAKKQRVVAAKRPVIAETIGNKQIKARLNFDCRIDKFGLN